MIFVGSPSRIFRKLTSLNTILKIRTRQMAEKGVEFSWFWAIRMIFASKITIRHVRRPIASIVWSKRFRTWKSRFISNYTKQIDFSWHFYDFCRVPIEDFPKNPDFEHGLYHQHDVNGQKRCSLAVISSVPIDFRTKSHGSSRPGVNCTVLLIEGVRKLKLNGFRQLQGVDWFFVTFWWFL